MRRYATRRSGASRPAPALANEQYTTATTPEARVPRARTAALDAYPARWRRTERAMRCPPGPLPLAPPFPATLLPVMRPCESHPPCDRLSV